MLKTAVAAKLLTLKAALVAVAAVSAGGLVLAASTDVLPNPFAPNNPAHSTPASTHPNGPNATPSPNLEGLCTAYLAGAGEANGHVLETPAFGALVRAAGSVEKVASFCNGLGVTAPGTGTPTESPSGHPSEPPTPTHHSGEPTSLPTTPSHP
jgi:hypothetical protein